MDMFDRTRNSVMDLNEVYFWTATIHRWQKLLEDDEYKRIIISSLEYLTNSNKIKVYGFVIMPNHIHLIWEMLDMNGKEKPYASFLKFTAHHFQARIRKHGISASFDFNVKESTRKQRYWDRDPLAIKITSREMLRQKLAYCHNNPLQEHWSIVKEPELYYWSSAYDYANNFTRFSFLKDYFDRV